MAGLAAEFGLLSPPFRWDTGRRTLIRAEIDALLLRAYGVDRSDADHIMDTFGAMQKAEVRQWGEYRTKRLVLERYDALIEAEHGHQPYRTVLDPPPADMSVAHDWTTKPDWYPQAGSVSMGQESARLYGVPSAIGGTS